MEKVVASARGKSSLNFFPRPRESESHAKRIILVNNPSPAHKQLAREAKAIVALAFRNGPIEDIHAGVRCSTCSGKPGHSHITDDEMRMIMKNAVNRVYALPCMKSDDPARYETQIEFGSRYTAQWDEPDIR